MKRAVLAVPLRAFEAEASTCAAARAETGRFIPAACVRAMAQASRRHSGWHLRGRAIMCRAQWQTSSSKPARATLEELFKAEPDRLSRLSFEVAGLYFDWSKTHLDRACDRAVPRPGRGDGLRCRPRRLVLGAGRQSERRPSGDPCRRARERRARGCGPRDRAAAADAGSGRRDRGGCIRRHHWRSSHRHRRIGAWPGAVGRRAWAAIVETGGAVPVEHRRRCFRRCSDDARSCDDARRRRVEDIHHPRNAEQFRGRLGSGCRMPASPIRTAG